MGLERVLIANRGEIAIRIARTARELGIGTVAVYSGDDANALHALRADVAIALPGVGAAAYLDHEAMADAAVQSGCDAIHPGYGFLSENAEFARRVAERSLVFIGPAPETLELFGDKLRARALAERLGVPVSPGISIADEAGAGVTLEEAREFVAALGAGSGGAAMLKAVAGGGGRGMQVVRDVAELEAAWPRCGQEAERAFGRGDLYLERLISPARHIEIQVAGDGDGAVVDFGERECSLQRRRQKIVEIAPAPNLSSAARSRMIEYARALATEARLSNLATFEFLLGEGDEVHFIEANPRLQVEHTVTEEIEGVDLVRLQFELAAGGALPAPKKREEGASRGFAIQARVHLETIDADGTVRPGSGSIERFAPPSGPGVRVDTSGYAGYAPNRNFDPLIAKVVTRTQGGNDEADGEFGGAVGKLTRALEEFEVTGTDTNLAFLRALLSLPEVLAGRFDTGFVEAHLPELLAAARELEATGEGGGAETASAAALAGVRVDAADPLAVLELGKSDAAKGDGQASPDMPSLSPASASPLPEPGSIVAPMQGTVIEVLVAPGDPVHAGRELLVMEAMKMQHAIVAERSGRVREIVVRAGDAVVEGSVLVVLDDADIESPSTGEDMEADLDALRPELEEILERRALTRDERRPDAVERRRRTNQRTARENVEDLVDPDSFTEYGALTLAARRARLPMDELIRRTPADGLVAGLGRVNGDLFDDERARCLVMAYDYTVLAGTQGKFNHQKKDRMFALAEQWRLPMVFFTEGGGGRPGDTDIVFAADLHIPAFHLLGRLSGLVPLVGIASGRCFAGNAVVLGCCDVVIATRDTNIGMGGPAMIEGGGLGVFRPEEVGPMEVQVPNGVVDIAVEDEAEAVAVARRYLSYFQGPVEDWTCADQRRLRHVVPEDRLRVYDVRDAVRLIADEGSVLELRREFGPGMVTALARVEGRPLGIIANNPIHLAGAVDSDGADKAARFMQLCDAFDLPIVCLCDTPGNLVGPEAEKTALVRHCCRLYVTGASVTVPMFTIVLRKSYGLGAQAMAAGSFHAPFFAVSWPTGEFGGMGLEGAVKLGYRKELAAIEDPEERMARYEEMVAAMYAQGKALNAATLFEIDDVIDPAETRRWIVEGLRACPPPPPRTGKKRSCIDTW